jgi:hypothetical protein
MSGVVQQMLANPSAFLPEGYQWSEYAPAMKIVPVNVHRQSTPAEDLGAAIQQTSPCCNAAIGGVMTDTSVIGLCRGCGHVVGEFNLAQNAVRVAEKIQ